MAIPDEPIPLDTLRVDTLTNTGDTIKPQVPGKDIAIQVFELGTNLPAAHRPVRLYQKFSSPFYPTFYLPLDSLGRTDDQGKFIWHWQGDSLPGNTYLGFSDWIYAEAFAATVYVGELPANSYTGWVFSSGVVHLHIEIRKDSLAFPGVELVQYKTGNYQQYPNWDSVIQFSGQAPIDTTITLNNTAPATFSYGLRYNLDNSSYQNYLYSPQTVQFQVTFQSRDTLFQHLVVE